MRTVFTLVIGIAIGGIGIGIWFSGFRPTSPDLYGDEDPQAGGPDRVIALGRIVPTGGVLSLPIPPAVRILSLAVAEGETVDAGQVLATLETAAALAHEVALANELLADGRRQWDAELAAANALVARAKLNVQQIQETETVEDAAFDEKNTALQLSVQQQEKDLQRLEKLSRDVASEQQLEHQKLLIEKATAEWRASVTSSKLSRTQRDFRKKAADADLISATDSQARLTASGEFKPLLARIELAKLRQENATIRAPVSGTILRIFVREGEAGGEKPLLQMANLESLQVVAEVFQTDVPRIAVNETASIRSDVWGDKQLSGTVQPPDAMVSTPELRRLDPLAPADRHVIRVPVALAPESHALARHWLHMQVDVILPVTTAGSMTKGSPPK